MASVAEGSSDAMRRAVVRLCDFSIVSMIAGGRRHSLPAVS
jgi:hypothetical protein